jgi:FAD/FMN-containing dehydrogenase
VRAYRDLYAGGGRQTPALLRRAVEDDRLSLYMCFTTSPYPDGEPVVVIYGLYIGPAADGAQVLAPLLRLGTPRLDQMGPLSYHVLLETLGHEVPYGLRSKWYGGYFQSGAMSDEAIGTMVRRFKGFASPYSMARFDLLGGGALARVRPDATAFVHRESLFYLSIIALWEAEEEACANLRWARAFHDDMRPFLSHEVYQNYANGELEDWPRAYYGSNYARLQRIKARYDPEDFFHHPQSIRLPLGPTGRPGAGRSPRRPG